MSFVIITGPYGPTMSPESSCIDKYIKELVRDFDIHVVCPKTDAGLPSNDGVSIHLVSCFWNNLRVISQSKLLHSTNRLNHLFWFILLSIVRARGYVLSFIAFPTRNRWLIKAYKTELNRLSGQIMIDAIISVGGLPCAHKAALDYKQKHPSVKWITYTLDPFTINEDVYKNCLAKNHRRKRNHKLEIQFWTNADWNIFTEELYEPMIEEFGNIKDNYICFPYVLQQPDIKERIEKSGNGDMRAVYAGALYLHIRNPQRMLSVMSHVKGVTLDLYTSGECDGIIREYLGDRIKQHNKLRREEYLSLINNQADILVNIGNSITLMAPSKFFEYIATGLPILNFYTVKNSNYYLTQHYPLGLNIGPEDNNAVEEGNEFCKRVKGKRLTFEEVEELFPNNSLTKQIAVLKQCLGII